MKTYTKLVRDKIPEIIEADGKKYEIEIASKEEYFELLKQKLIEETEEFIEAVKKEDDINMVEELGDILMQVLYHTNLGERSGYFSLEEVLETLNKKLRRRHPHVFDGVEAKSIEEVEILWQEIKAKEMRGKNETR